MNAGSPRETTWDWQVFRGKECWPDEGACAPITRGRESPAGARDRRHRHLHVRWMKHLPGRLRDARGREHSLVAAGHDGQRHLRRGQRRDHFVTRGAVVDAVEVAVIPEDAMQTYHQRLFMDGRFADDFGMKPPVEIEVSPTTRRFAVSRTCPPDAPWSLAYVDTDDGKTIHERIAPPNAGKHAQPVLWWPWRATCTVGNGNGSSPFTRLRPGPPTNSLRAGRSRPRPFVQRVGPQLDASDRTHSEEKPDETLPAQCLSARRRAAPAAVLEKIMREVRAVNDEMRAAGAWSSRAGSTRRARRPGAVRDGEVLTTDGRTSRARSTSAGSSSCGRRISRRARVGTQGRPGHDPAHRGPAIPRLRALSRRADAPGDGDRPRLPRAPRARRGRPRPRLRGHRPRGGARPGGLRRTLEHWPASGLPPARWDRSSRPRATARWTGSGARRRARSGTPSRPTCSRPRNRRRRRAPCATTRCV